MEPNSSSVVCIATSNNTDNKSSQKLQQDDTIPLYATVIPSCSRKFRNQLQQQQQPQLQTSSKQQEIIKPNSRFNIEDRHKSNKTNDNESTYSSTSASTASDSLEIWSQEIPVWIKGEQRWISGVTDQTTCYDLIEALLVDEGVIKSTTDNNSMKVNEYVITERWRRVEQILDGRTKILSIWAAWGAEQSEVKFTLRRRPESHHSLSYQYQRQTNPMGDKDSGRGSPTGSINSAIVRRRRHRASRSSFAWITHGQTIHPKSQKNSIERLMKLILEQGEVIQQQLAKLRDRELEISNIEEEQHKIREKEHGKNYLLETYLNGLQDADDKQELGTGNSDSGVHTEETITTASPEVTPQNEDEISETLLLTKTSRKKRSKRESELLLEHESTKEFSNTITVEKPETANEPMNDEIQAQIDILEKLIVLNKHLQREEELMVRLGAKIKRYEADASGLTEQQVKESLNRVNEQLDNNSQELHAMENEIKNSEDILNQKTDVLKKLYDELEEAEVEHRKLAQVQPAVVPDLVCSSDMPPLPKLSLDDYMKNEDNLNLSREYLAENIYNISKMILKNNAPGPSHLNTTDYIRHTPDSLSNEMQMFQITSQQPLSYQYPQNRTVIQAQVHMIPPEQPSTSKINPIQASMSYLEKINQRIQKPNDNSINNFNNNNNAIMQATNIKLGPKKLINKHVISNDNNHNNIYKQQYMKQPSQIKIDGDSNSDTGLSSLGDVSQLGTLV